MFTVYFNSQDKLYSQIYQAVVKAVLQGELKPREKLPSRRALAEHLGVSVNTVKQAYNQLVDEGYIVARERSGYYVDKLNIDLLPPQTPQPVLQAEPMPDKPCKTYCYDFSSSALDTAVLPRSLVLNSAKTSLAELLQKVSAEESNYALRLALVRYLAERRAVRVEPEAIVITTGHQENLRILSQVLPGAIFAAEDPGYPRNFKFFQEQGYPLIPIPLDRYGLSVADLEKTPSEVVIVTPNHQFPTGIIMGLRRSQRLLAWAQGGEGRYIVEDSYDSDFKYSGHPIPALKSLDLKDQVILSGSFSQITCHLFNLAYLILPRPLLERYRQISSGEPSASHFAQAFMAEFMQSEGFGRYLNRLRSYNAKKRNIIVEAIKQRQGLEARGAEAGLHLILRVTPASPYFGEEGKQELETYWEQAGIRIRPVSSYAVQAYLEAQDYLLGFGALSADELPTALQLLLKPFAHCS